MCMYHDGGVLKVILKEGPIDVKPSKGDTVFVHYTGTLASNGKKFDSSRDRKEEFSFGLGNEQVIKGWDLGVKTMKKGEKAVFRIGYEYAYGEYGSPPKIPGKAVLDFEIELISFFGEDISPARDGTITRSIKFEGEKYQNPAEYADVNVGIVATHEGVPFLSNDNLWFALGEGLEKGLCSGMELAIRRMTRGEKSIFNISGAYHSYKDSERGQFNLPHNAHIQVEIFLKDFIQTKHSWEMSTEEKIDAAIIAKDRGNKYLKEDKLTLALNLYNRCISLIDHLKDLEPECETKWRQTVIAGHLNASLVHQKGNENLDCIKSCDKVLTLDPKNIKALYRKGQALQQRKDFQAAINYYNQVLISEPDNKAAQSNIQISKKAMQEEFAKDKKTYSRLFDKGLKNDGKKEESKASVEDVTSSDKLRSELENDCSDKGDTVSMKSEGELIPSDPCTSKDDAKTQVKLEEVEQKEV
uniref:Peptidylprolyl isomerase n=1 Tax=Rhabditophanes sp. KR3021 TaxID=114890 RepID=A0AC35U9T8_9BILA